MSSRMLTMLTWTLCAVLASGVLPSLASAEEIALDDYRGAWTRVAIDQDDEARNTAIDQAVASLPWMMRTFAGPFLRRSILPPGSVEFAVDGEVIEFAEQGKGSRPLQLDGTETVKVGDDGKSYRLRSSIADNAIQMHWVGDQAMGSNLYQVSEDGSQLVVHHTIHVTQVSGVAPIVYQSRFARVPEVAAKASD